MTAAHSSVPVLSGRPGPARASTAASIEVVQSGTWTQTIHHPAWAWRCDTCGWLGVELMSENAARGEGERHLERDHRAAL